MRITESRIRRIIRDELIREGFFDDVMGRVRGMFGGADGVAAPSDVQPIKLSDLIPLAPAIGAAGLKRADIDRLANGPAGSSLRTRTRPAAFTFGLTPMADGVQWGHPFLVKGALDDQPELERLVGGRHHSTQTPSLVIPKESRFTSDRRLGDTKAFPKGTPSDAELRRLGVNMDMWTEYTRDLPREKRDRRARELGRALIVVEVLKTAFKVLDDAFPNSGALFRPVGG